MANNKTVPSKEDVYTFIDAVEHPRRKRDAQALCAMMETLTGEKPVMWGESLIGFGQYHYQYESGREGDFFLTGFAPRKTNMVVYIMPGFEPYKDLTDKLGKYKTGRSCLYINKLEDVDMKVLEKLIKKSVADMKKMYDVS